jgi:hypothetical protein
MAGVPAGWQVTYRGCEVGSDCDSVRFEVQLQDGTTLSFEVRTTAQVEYILARELGHEAITPRDREKILSMAGRRLVEDAMAAQGAVARLILLDSRLFREPGAERTLLRASGLLLG